MCIRDSISSTTSGVVFLFTAATSLASTTSGVVAPNASRQQQITNSLVLAIAKATQREIERELSSSSSSGSLLKLLFTLLTSLSLSPECRNLMWKVGGDCRVGAGWCFFFPPLCREQCGWMVKTLDPGARDFGFGFWLMQPPPPPVPLSPLPPYPLLFLVFGVPQQNVHTKLWIHRHCASLKKTQAVQPK